MVGWILAIFIFILAVSCCCASDGDSSSNNTAKRNTTTRRTSNNNTNDYYYHYSYSECPSCGAPYYDGYCEECGYPDINQGWIGENY
jgi:hypothetical protein